MSPPSRVRFDEINDAIGIQADDHAPRSRSLRFVLNVFNRAHPFFPFLAQRPTLGFDFLGAAGNVAARFLAIPNALHHLPEGVVPRQLRQRRHRHLYPARR